MGKALRVTRRSGVSVQTPGAYPYAPKRVHPRSKPLQRTPYSSSDLRRLFASVNSGQNGGQGASQATLARRAAAGVERLLARLMRPSLSRAPVTLHSVLSTAGEQGPGDSSDDEGSMQSWTTEHSMSGDRPLKRLGFVLAYGGYYYNWGVGVVSSVYATGRALVPGPLDAVAGSLEHRVAALSLPVIAAVQDQSEKVLTALDAKIDGVISTAAGVAGAPAAFLSSHSAATAAKEDTAAAEVAAAGPSQDMRVVVEAKNAYLAAVEDGLRLIQERGVTGAATCAAEKLMASVGKAKDIPPALEEEARQLMLKVGEAWSRLAQLPPVSLLLAAVQPSVEFTWHKYLAAHDALVATPTYNKAVGLTAEQLGRVQGSYMYKALYPRISPYADPALDALASTQTYSALVDHLRPMHIVQSS